MSTNHSVQPPSRPIVPKELAGKWIAWTLDGQRIVAHGETLTECQAASVKVGEARVRFEKTRQADERLSRRPQRQVILPG